MVWALIGAFLGYLGIALLFGLTKKGEIREVSARWVGFRKKNLDRKERRYEVFTVDCPDGTSVQITALSTSGLEMNDAGIIQNFKVCRYGVPPPAALGTAVGAIFCIAAADVIFAPAFSYHFPQAIFYGEAFFIAAAIIIRQGTENSFDWEVFRKNAANRGKRWERDYGAARLESGPPMVRNDLQKLDVQNTARTQASLAMAGFFTFVGLLGYAAGMKTLFHPHASAIGQMTLASRPKVIFSDSAGQTRSMQLAESSLFPAWRQDKAKVEVIYDPAGRYAPLVNRHGWDLIGLGLGTIFLIALGVIYLKTITRSNTQQSNRTPITPA